MTGADTFDLASQRINGHEVPLLDGADDEDGVEELPSADVE